MKLTAKIKFGCKNTKIESFGGNRYLVYLTISHHEPDRAMKEFIFLMSKHLGVPPNKIHYKGKGIGDEQIFDVD